MMRPTRAQSLAVNRDLVECREVELRFRYAKNCVIRFLLGNGELHVDFDDWRLFQDEGSLRAGGQTTLRGKYA
jgi:hypothetical protein